MSEVTPEHKVPPRTYLGDGLYAEHDGYQIKLAANNGVYDTDVVYLEPLVFDALLEFVKRVTQ